MNTTQTVNSAVQEVLVSHKGLFINCERLFNRVDEDIHNKKILSDLLFSKLGVGLPSLRISLDRLINELNPTYDSLYFLFTVLLEQQKEQNSPR